MTVLGAAGAFAGVRRTPDGAEGHGRAAVIFASTAGDADKASRRCALHHHS